MAWRRGAAPGPHARAARLRLPLAGRRPTAAGLDRFDLVGLSLGSRCSMAYARDNWRRIRHLALVDMGPQMAKVGARGLRADMTAKADVPPSTFTFEDALSFFRGQWPTLDAPPLPRRRPEEFAAALRDFLLEGALPE